MIIWIKFFYIIGFKKIKVEILFLDNYKFITLFGIFLSQY